MFAKIKPLIARIQALRPVRAFTRYSAKHGELLAGGLGITALFSVFAAIYVAFSIVGFVLEANPALKDSVVSSLSISIPGLIDTGSGGAINLERLFRSKVLNWTSVIALVLLLGTALGWLGSAREAVREIFDLPAEKTFFLLLKLKDFGLIVAFGAVTILSAALSIFSTRALDLVLGLVGIGRTTFFAVIAARIIGLLIVLAIDTVILGALFRVLAGVPIPRRRLLVGSLIGGIALGILKALGASIIGGAGRNPLLASFAVILGLVIWFNLICRVILLAAAYISVDMSDHGQSAQKMARRSGMLPPARHPRPRVRPVGRLR